MFWFRDYFNNLEDIGAQLNIDLIVAEICVHSHNHNLNWEIGSFDFDAWVWHTGMHTVYHIVSQAFHSSGGGIRERRNRPRRGLL